MTQMQAASVTFRTRSQPKGSDWINTYAGRRFHPLDPDINEIDIIDIAHALSLNARYCGHTVAHYSVAQHSVYVSQRCSPHLALWGLLHDASEAYLGDVTRPIKRMPTFAAYKQAENRLMGAICMRFKLDIREPAEVKEADNRVLYTEAMQLVPRRHADWKQHAEPYPDLIITPWEPKLAEVKFLARYVELTRDSSVMDRLRVYRTEDQAYAAGQNAIQAMEGVS